MGIWILDNLSWGLPIVFLAFGWLVKILRDQAIRIAEDNSRSVAKRIYDRIDLIKNESDARIEAIDDATKELVILRREDKERQDRFEQQMLKLLDELKGDVKLLLRMRSLPTGEA